MATVAERTAAPKPADTRCLHGRVFADQRGRPLERKRSFRAGARHEVVVFIAERDAKGIVLEGGAFPTPEFPAGVAFHELEVIFNVIGEDTAPLKKTIALGREGPSTEARFPWHIAAGRTEAGASVLVLHKGRHLQSGTLSGPVSDADADAGAGIRFVPGEASMSDREHQSAADLTIETRGEELLVVRRGQAPDLLFNYLTARNRAWSDADDQQKRGYTASYPPTTKLELA